jgi:hypothetical protein
MQQPTNKLELLLRWRADNPVVLLWKQDQQKWSKWWCGVEHKGEEHSRCTKQNTTINQRAMTDQCGMAEEAIEVSTAKTEQCLGGSWRNIKEVWLRGWRRWAIVWCGCVGGAWVRGCIFKRKNILSISTYLSNFGILNICTPKTHRERCAGTKRPSSLKPKLHLKA